MERKKISIGQSDFKTVITDRYYIDKSLFIKDVLEADTSVLITRPRRFGKTLNMSMLKYFYDVQENNKELFTGLQIETVEGGKYMEKCGKHPVIFMSFKDLKYATWEDMFKGFIHVVLDACLPFISALQSEKLNQKEKNVFEQLFSEKITIIGFNTFLKTICKVLTEHYGEKVVILIDEYDTPVIYSYTNTYYNEMINLMRIFLSGGLKDNPYLEKGILTGITRIAKESMFSGLNNFEMYSILDDDMADKFGFTQEEVDTLLQNYDLFDKKEGAKEWYNSYQFGVLSIYNPWSILNFVNKKGKYFEAFWVQTSDNALVKEVMFNKEASIRNKLEDLIQEKWIKIRLERHLSFGELYTNVDVAWNLLLFSGYLTYRNIEMIDYEEFCEVSVPNKELLYVFKRFIRHWVETPIQHSGHEDMLLALLTGQIAIFKKILQRFVEAVFSYHDTGGDMPEKFYHAFFLGLMVKLEYEYHIFSNKEIGYGRADICLVPRRDKSKLGIIIELKSPDKRDKETLTKGLEMAEKQILNKDYAAIMKEYNVPNFIALAISVQGKKSMVKEVCITKN